MNRSRIPSPARSEGPPVTPRCYKPRGPRSLGSSSPGRLSSVIDKFREQNRDSLQLSPLQKTVLNDVTDIEQPRRHSWWKKVDTSRDALEVLDNNKMSTVHNVIEEIDMEVISQENREDTLDLPESSDCESIHSIVVPQRRFFQKENQPQKESKQKLTRKEVLKTQFENTLDLPESSGSESICSIVLPKQKLFDKKDNKAQNKFNQVISRRQSINKHDKTSLSSKSEGTKKIDNDIGKEIPLSQDKTISDKTKDVTLRAPPRSLFGNRDKPKSDKFKNMFAAFVVSDSEEEMSDVQPTLFAFQKNSNPVRHSTKGVRNSSPRSSITTDMELDDWKLLPSSTMLDNQIEVNSPPPVKKIRLSKLSEAKESGTSTNIDTMSNKTNQSNKHMQEEIMDKHMHEEIIEKPAEQIIERNVTDNDKMDTNEENVNSLHNKIEQEIEKEQQNMVEESNTKETANAEMLQEIETEDQLQKNKHESVQESKGEEAHVSKNEEQYENNDDKNEELERESENEKIAQGNANEDLAQKSIERNVIENDDMDTNQENGRHDEKEQEIEEEHHSMVDESIAKKTPNVEILLEMETEKQPQINQHESVQESKEEEAHKSKKEEQYENDEKQYENNEEENEEAARESETEEKAEESENEDLAQKIELKTQESENEEVEESVHEENSLEEYESEIEDQANEGQIEEQAQEQENEVEEQESEIEDQAHEAEIEDRAHEAEIEDQSHETDIEDQAHESEDELQESENEAQEERSEIEDQGHVSEIEEQAQESENEVQESEKEDQEEKSEIEDQGHESEFEEQESENEVQESGNEAQEKKNEIEDQGQESEFEEQEQANENGVLRFHSESENEAEEENSDIEQGHESENNDLENEDTSDQSDNEEIMDTEEDTGEQQQNEIEESPNVTHDTTGRHRNKNDLISPEVPLHEVSNHADSFVGQGRNTSIRKTTLLKNFNMRPSMATPKENTGISDGTRNSSAEGSGWDSHRTTRKTLRQTFGKDFTPRKSLRALVMEKSAKRQTVINEANAELRMPQANSTELPNDDEVMDEHDYIEESNHEVSMRTRQTKLEMFWQNVQRKNMEMRQKVQLEVRESLKRNNIRRDCLNFAIQKSTIRKPKSAAKPKRTKTTEMVSLENLPPELAEDMKYKPPKRFRPRNASWITKRLYQYLETKLEPKYDYKARVRAEKLVETLYNFVRDHRKERVAPTPAIEALKKEFARLNIVKTHYEFYNFIRDYLPKELKWKIIPDLVNGIPMPRHLFGNIINEELN